MTKPTEDPDFPGALDAEWIAPDEPEDAHAERVILWIGIGVFALSCAGIGAFIWAGPSFM